MSYRLTTGLAILRLSDGANIPVTKAGGCLASDPDGSDALTLAAWIAAGNIPEQADPTPILPRSLSDGDLSLVLVKKGVLTQDDVDAAIAAVDIK